MTNPSPPARARGDRLDTVRALTRLLDEAIRIPGTNIRFGLDALLGLIPGLGDVSGGLMGAYALVAAARLGAPPSVIARMLLNIGIDTVVGAVPVLGDLFDVGWKANSRNLALLERYADRPQATRSSSRAMVAGALVLLLALIAGGIWLAVAVVRALVGLVS